MILEHDAYAETMKAAGRRMRSFSERTDAFLELAKAVANRTALAATKSVKKGPIEASGPNALSEAKAK